MTKENPTIKTPLEVLRCIEGDTEGNIAKTQLVIFSACNRTEIVVRLYVPNNNALRDLYAGNKSNGQVSDMILDYLRTLSIIGDTKNWEYSNLAAEKVNDADQQILSNYSYWGWRVSSNLLNF